MNNIGNKDLYKEFCLEATVPLFFQPYWLDAACNPGNWDVALYMDKGGAIRGVWPYAIRRLGLWWVSRMPPLTPYLGIWFNYPLGLSNPHKRRAFERRVVSELLEQLPRVAYLKQSFMPNFTDWLPFYWNGFHQYTYYTYEILPGASQTVLFQNLKGNVRNKLRKAVARLICELSENLAQLYLLVEMSFQRQGLAAPFPYALLQRIDQVLAHQSRRRLYLAKDGQGRPHAGIYLVWDDSRMYNLILGADPDHRQSGAAPFLLWRGIQDAMSMGLIFDFEGSMIEGVEQLFHSFGGRQQPYFSIFKGRNRFFDAAAFLLHKRL